MVMVLCRPGTLDKLSPMSSLPLFYVLWTVADHSPTTHIFKGFEYLWQAHLHPTPEGDILASNYEGFYLLLVLSVRPQRFGHKFLA